MSTACDLVEFHTKNETDQVTIWKCVTCDKSGCSRYSVNGCMPKHFKETDHPVCVNFAECKIWCYHCDEDLFELSIEASDSEEQSVKDFIQKVGEVVAHLQSVREKEYFKKVNEKLEKTIGGPQTETSTGGISPNDIFHCKSSVEDKVFGLNNMGNTCFFNSLTQVILQSGPLLERLRTDFPDLPQEGFISELLKLSDSAKTSKNALTPRGLFDKLRRHRKMYSSYGQQDSHECFTHFMEMMENEYKEAKKTFMLPVIGYNAYQTGCLGCNKEDWFFEESCSLVLDLANEEFPEEASIEQAIQNQTPTHQHYKTIDNDKISNNQNVEKSGFDKSTERLQMDTRNNKALEFNETNIESLIDKYFSYSIHSKSKTSHKCSVCEQNQVSEYACFKKFYLVTPPQILVVVLKRFKKKNLKYIEYEKESKSVPIAMELDLSRYLLGKSKADDQGIQFAHAKYSLYGIVIQQGHLSAGHYVCYVKKESGNWYYASDSYIAKVEESKVKHNDSGYLLFYHLT